MFGAGVGADCEMMQYSFYSPLTCARNSRRYLNTDRRGNFADEGDIAAQNAISKASLYRASTRGNDPARATEFSPVRGANGSRMNDFSPGSRSRTNLVEATGASMGSGLGNFKTQRMMGGGPGVNF